jgi:hypothetical protein
LHRLAKGDIGLLAPLIEDDSSDDDDKKERAHNGPGQNQGASIVASPLQPMLGGVNKLIVLERLAGLLIHVSDIPLRVTANSTRKASSGAKL